MTNVESKLNFEKNILLSSRAKLLGKVQGLMKTAKAMQKFKKIAPKQKLHPDNMIIIDE